MVEEVAVGGDTIVVDRNRLHMMIGIVVVVVVVVTVTVMNEMTTEDEENVLDLDLGPQLDVVGILDQDHQTRRRNLSTRVKILNHHHR